MASVIQNMIHGVLDDGARKTKFDCIINFNSMGLFPNSRDLATLIKTSNFPGRTNDVIDFKFKGQTIPLKGQNKFDNTWTCTFYLTQDHKLKQAFEKWMESLEQVHNKFNVAGDIRNAQATNRSSGYTTTAQIIQLDFEGSQQTAVYELYNVFPKSIQSIDTDYSAVAAIQEFQVEFSYSYYISKSSKGALGGFVDEFKSDLMNVAYGVVGSVKQQITNTLANGIDAIVGAGKDLLAGNNPFTEKNNPFKDFGSNMSAMFDGIGSSVGGMISKYTD